MEIPQDDLKWFGQGLDGFPKKLPNDVVEYIICIIDTKLSHVQTRERLQAFQRSMHQLEKKFLKEYIWQRESLKLDLVREDGRWLLRGQTNYGDSVADEWLIVWFLGQLSKEFGDAWIRIYDADGEFLLIEAANALPKWLTPEVAENRVWINNHRLLLIPLSKLDVDPAPLSIKEALAVFETTPARPQHYPKIEKEAFHRLSSYPSAIKENQHHVTLPLPRKVAYILHINPSYISPVVEAFYLRDPVSIRLLQPDKSKIPLIFNPDDFVEVSVRFTKILYAQIIGQQWNPPPSWKSAQDSLVEAGHAAEKVEVGVKVAAGMQILQSHSFFASNKPVRELTLLLEDLENGDDSLPTDIEIAAWPKREDDEKWLDIDFTEFEKELAGKGRVDGKGFGDKGAQDTLKKMVERFNTFLADDEADYKGATEFDPMDVDNDSDAEGRGWDDPETDESNDSAPPEEQTARKGKNVTRSDTKGKSRSHHVQAKDDPVSDYNSDDEEADAEYAEYEAAYAKFMILSASEKALLTDEARILALNQDAEKEEDDEIKKLTEAMEAELFSHGALNLNPKEARLQGKGLLSKGTGKGKANLDQIYEDGEGDSTEEDGLLDEDYNLADNMLKAFKGQAGMAGPAGNMMKLMGVQFPRDADDEIKSQSTVKGKEKGAEVDI